MKKTLQTYLQLQVILGHYPVSKLSRYVQVSLAADDGLVKFPQHLQRVSEVTTRFSFPYVVPQRANRDKKIMKMTIKMYTKSS